MEIAACWAPRTTLSCTMGTGVAAPEPFAWTDRAVPPGALSTWLRLTVTGVEPLALRGIRDEQRAAVDHVIGHRHWRRIVRRARVEDRHQPLLDPRVAQRNAGREVRRHVAERHPRLVQRDRRAVVDLDAVPVAGLGGAERAVAVGVAAGAVVLQRGEHHRRGGGPVGDQRALDLQGAGLQQPPRLDHRSRLHGQRRALRDRERVAAERADDGDEVAVGQREVGGHGAGEREGGDLVVAAAVAGQLGWVQSVADDGDRRLLGAADDVVLHDGHRRRGARAVAPGPTERSPPGALSTWLRLTVTGVEPLALPQHRDEQRAAVDHVIGHRHWRRIVRRARVEDRHQPLLDPRVAQRNAGREVRRHVAERHPRLVQRDRRAVVDLDAVPVSGLGGAERAVAVGVAAGAVVLQRGEHHRRGGGPVGDQRALNLQGAGVAAAARLDHRSRLHGQRRALRDRDVTVKLYDLAGNSGPCRV